MSHITMAQQGKADVDSVHSSIIRIWLNYPDSALNLADSAYQLSKQVGDDALISKSLRLIGGVYYYMGDYDSVIHYSNLSLAIAQQISDSALINNAYNNIGLANYNLGNYQTSLEYLLRSLAIKEILQAEYGLGTTLNNIGLVYEKLKDYEKAREYFARALIVAERQADKNLILYSQNNIGNTYLSENNVAKAEYYFQLSLAVDVDNKNWKAVTYSGLGQVNQRRGNYEESQIYFQKSKKLREEINDKRGISELYYHFSKEALLQKQYDSAIVLLQESQRVAKEIGAKDLLFENLALFVDIYQAIGDVRQAFTYQTRYLQLRDTLFNENMARHLSQFQLKLQAEESDRVLKQKQVQLEENQRFLSILVGIIVVILLLVIIVYNQLRLNKRKNEQLKVRNNEISMQKEEIETQKESLLEKNTQLENAQQVISKQNKQLEKYNEQLQNTVDQKTDELKERNDQLLLANIELDNFIYKSSHDIKGPLATLLGMCHVALLDIKEEKAKGYFQKLYESALDLNSILTRLKTISEISNLEMKRETIDFAKIIEECVDQNSKIEGDETLNVAIDIEDNLMYKSDKGLLDLIFFNIIQSAIKMREHGSKGSSLTVKIYKHEGLLQLDVIDSSNSTKSKELGDVFELFAQSALQHRTLGLGLYIVKQSVQKLRGTIVLLDDMNHTHFKITLPLS